MAYTDELLAVQVYLQQLIELHNDDEDTAQDLIKRLRDVNLALGSGGAGGGGDASAVNQISQISIETGIRDRIGATTDAKVADPLASGSVIALLKGILEASQNGGATGLAQEIKQDDQIVLATALNDLATEIRDRLPATEDFATETTLSTIQGLIAGFGTEITLSAIASSTGTATDSAVSSPLLPATHTALLKGLLNELQNPTNVSNLEKQEETIALLIEIRDRLLADAGYATETTLTAVEGWLQSLGATNVAPIVDPTVEATLLAIAKGLLQQSNAIASTLGETDDAIAPTPLADSTVIALLKAIFEALKNPTYNGAFDSATEVTVVATLNPTQFTTTAIASAYARSIGVRVSAIADSEFDIQGSFDEGVTWDSLIGTQTTYTLNAGIAEPYYFEGLNYLTHVRVLCISGQINIKLRRGN